MKPQRIVVQNDGEVWVHRNGAGVAIGVMHRNLADGRDKGMGLEMTTDEARRVATALQLVADQLDYERSQPIMDELKKLADDNRKADEGKKL